jgi:hypothetical protein
MAEGINIKILPQVGSALGNDRILIDRNVTGTVVIPFSAIVVNENQVTFYSDFVNLSAYTYALSASTNAVFAQVSANISSVNTEVLGVSTNVLQLSSQTSSTTFILRTDLNTVSTNVIQIETNVDQISSNMTTFISGGISPSGSIIPEKVGILYFSADTKDYFLSTDTLSATDWKRILTVDY